MKIIDQLKEIREVVYKNKETTDRLETNWDFDRKDFSEFQNRLGHLEVEFKSLREQLQKIPGQTQDRVSEVIQPMIDSNESLNETIQEKKSIIVTKKKHWWQFK